MAGGRPTDYDPAHCETVEAFMAQGFSKMAAAGTIGVCYQTLKNWMAVHPEFLAAVKRGESKRTVKLETDLLLAVSGPQVTSRIFALKNAAPDEWRDKVVTEHVGKDDGPIQTEDQGLSRLMAYVDSIAERSGTAGEADK